MRLLVDIFLILFVIFFWLFVSDFLTGAPTTIVNYYFASYDTTTTGEIERSQVRNMRYGGAVYDIYYRYNVDNFSYTSDQINFISNNKDVAYSTVKRYPVGRKVQVYYDKSKPMLSVLEITPLDNYVWVSIIASLLMSLFTMYLLPLGISNTIQRFKKLKFSNSK